VKAGTYFAAATAALIAISYVVLQLGFHSPGDSGALKTSATIAIAVQLVTFAIARRMPVRNLMLGWGIGAVLRVLVLAVYALLVVPALGLPSAAALVSLVTFMFLSMLIEPLLLAYDR
jgi:Mg/Co/Ni transporter MgtE